MEKILLPIDGSETCQKAYDFAKKYAKNFDATVHILYVRSGYSGLFDEGEKMAGINEFISEKLGHKADIKELTENQKDMVMDDLIYKILDNGRKFFEKDNIAVETVTLSGKPANEIIDFAENEDFDLVIMCTHGMGGFRRFTMGSTTNKVVHHVKVPIVVIR